jgi:hypothetical protein
MTLIDVLVGSAIALIIFLAVFQLLRVSALVSTLAAETAAATAIANTQMEYIRSLPYDDVGTVGGIPAGSIPQEATTTEDNVPYGVRVFVGYYDDPADGSGGSDSNGITTDYKRAKVSVTFTAMTGTHTVTVSSVVAPPGVETTTGGGTLRIAAVDATGAAVPGATVSVENQTITPAVDLSTFTDASGVALLPGAATSTGYEITVTKDGYSTAQTYDRDTTNQNPNPGHLTVVANQTTSGTFAIDRLATLTINTYTVEASTSSLIPEPNVAFTLTGAKTIGSTGAGAPIYKTVIATSTDASGTATLSLEWDTYTFAVSGYAEASTSLPTPFQIYAGTATSTDVVLTP